MSEPIYSLKFDYVDTADGVTGAMRSSFYRNEHILQALIHFANDYKGYRITAISMLTYDWDKRQEVVLGSLDIPQLDETLFEEQEREAAAGNLPENLRDGG